MTDKRTVDEIAQEIRMLNGLDEKAVSVRYGSYHEIVYEGELKKLKLPEGYYCDVYYERGVQMQCITNKKNIAPGEMARIFVVHKR